MDHNSKRKAKSLAARKFPLRSQEVDEVLCLKQDAYGGEASP